MKSLRFPIKSRRNVSCFFFWLTRNIDNVCIFGRLAIEYVIDYRRFVGRVRARPHYIAHCEIAIFREQEDSINFCTLLKADRFRRYFMAAGPSFRVKTIIRSSHRT